MLNQQLIRNLFGLPSNEEIFDDFTCNHNKKPGKLYVFENYICFYTDFLGVNKLTLKFANVDEIIKGKSSIEVKLGTEAHKFTSFDNFESVYEFIYKTWINCCPDKSSKLTKGSEEPKSNPLPEVSSQVPSNKVEVQEGSKRLSVNERESRLQGSVFEMDDAQMIQKSLEKYPKRENEHTRLVFGLTIEQYFKRFIDTEAAYPDTKNLEVMGSKDIKDGGWVKDESDATCKKRIVNLQYKSEGNTSTPFMESKKENILYYTS